MSEPIELELEHNNKTYHLRAEVESRGYTYRVRIELENMSIYFEPDEEGLFRALTDTANQDTMKNIDSRLLKEIADLLGDAFNGSI